MPYVVAAIVSSRVFRRFLRRRGTFEHTEPTKSYRELRREFWRFTWPRSITRISQMAIQRMDIILVAALRSPTEAAIYTAATRFVALGQFGTQAIQQVLQPKFTALLANDEPTASRTSTRSQRHGAWPSPGRSTSASGGARWSTWASSGRSTPTRASPWWC